MTNEIVIYETPNKEIKIDVRLEKETVWLSQNQIAVLFDTERSVVTKHIGNIFKSGELDEKSNVQKMHIATSDKPTKLYSLDTVICVGYRVNSVKATHFRIWASNIIKGFLIKGYTLNEQRLSEIKNKFKELQATISFMEEKSKGRLLTGHEGELLHLLSSYAKTFTLLEAYDNGEVTGKNKDPYRIMFNISVDSVTNAYNELKNKDVEFIAKPFKAPTFESYFATFKDLDGNIVQFIGGK